MYPKKTFKREEIKDLQHQRGLIDKLGKIINIVSMVISRPDHLGHIARFLQNDRNFKKRKPSVDKK